MEKVLLYGSKLSNNLGGPSIFFGALELFDRSQFEIHFTPQSDEDDPIMFSYYLELSNVQHAKLPRQRFIYLEFLQLMIACFLPRLKFRLINHLERKGKFVKVLNEYNVVCDIRGISQTDYFGNNILNYFNENVILISSKMLNKKVIKFPQDMGPFKKKSNRIIAKILLPKYDLLISRGIITKELLNQIGVHKNVITRPDCGFLVNIKDDFVGYCLNKLNLNESKFIVIAASSQIYRRSDNVNGINVYLNNMVRLIDDIQSYFKYKIILLPNELKPGNRKSDDLFVSKKIYNNVHNKENVIIIDCNPNVFEIKYLVSKSEFVISSRYHTVVAALSAKIPVFVIGWGFKYDELLSICGISDLIVNHKEFDYDLAFRIVKRIISDLDHYKSILEKNTPEVVKSVETIRKSIETIIVN